MLWVAGQTFGGWVSGRFKRSSSAFVAVERVQCKAVAFEVDASVMQEAFSLELFGKT